MSQLEYGDYYKFAASAGIALLVAAALLPWAFLREPFDLLLQTSKIALLTPEAQRLIYKRQHLVDVIVDIVPWISVALAVAGGFLTGFGLIKWRYRQTVRDRGEDLDVQKKDKELHNMSREEVENKARDDAESLEEQPLRALIAEAPSPTNVYLAVETAVLSRLRACYGSDIQCNQRLGRVEFDAIVRTADSERVIIEIKYIRKGFHKGWLTESLNGLAARTQLYSNTFSRNARGVLLIVLGAESRQSLTPLIAETSERIQSTSSSVRFSNLRISTLREAEIATISCQEVGNLLS